MQGLLLIRFLNDFILSCGLDFLFVTEAWLNVDEINPLFEMAPESLNILSTPRQRWKEYKNILLK